VTINVLLSDIVIICAISLCSLLVAVFRRFVGAGESVESSDLHPGSVARSVFCNLLFRASFVKINDVVRPVIRYDADTVSCLHASCTSVNTFMLISVCLVQYSFIKKMTKYT